MASPMAELAKPLTDSFASDQEEWLELTRRVLPELAKRHRWPLRLDHCFQRVCLDHAFGDVWYHHVRKPALHNIQPDALKRAVQCAQEIAREGEPLLRARNLESLRYRGKLKDPDAASLPPPRTAAG